MQLPYDNKVSTSIWCLHKNRSTDSLVSLVSYAVIIGDATQAMDEQAQAEREKKADGVYRAWEMRWRNTRVMAWKLLLDD